MKLPFFGGQYKGPSTESNPQECVNLIAEIDQVGGLNSLSIRPGLTELADLTDEETQTEVLSNGDFDSDSNWTLGTQWYITEGKLVSTPANKYEYISNGTFSTDPTTQWTLTDSQWYISRSIWLLGNSVSSISQSTELLHALVPGKTYRCSIHIESFSTVNSGIRFEIGGTQGTPRTVAGTYVENIVAGSGGAVVVTAIDTGTACFIDNISVVEADGASYATQDSTDMAGSLSEGVTHRLTFTVSGYDGGYVTPIVGGTNGAPVNANGDYSMDVVSGSGADFAFYRSATFAGSIDDVSLMEIVYPHREIRGMHQMGSYVYVVHGDQLKQLDSTYASTTLTSSTEKLSTKSGPVTMAHINNASGGLQLMICDGSDGVAYIYDTTTALFTRLTTSEHDFYGGGSVAAQDSMFISNRPNTDEFYISATQDGLTWDILDVQTAEAKTSNTVRVISAFQKLWVTKGDSTEEFYDSGGDPVWERSTLALVELGTLAVHSWALVDNALLWLAHDRTVRMSRGSSDAQIVSTYHISREIEKMTDATDAIGYGFVQNNHSYYVLTFPSANQTLVYDLSNGLWYSWASFTEDGSQDDGRFRGNCYAEFNGVDLVGDYSNNKIYKIDQSNYTDDGNRIRRTRVFAPPKSENKNIFMHEFELDVNTGSGINTGQGSTPKAMLQISRDGGKTYGNELWANIGQIGEYKDRARWFRLGAAREPVIKVTISDPIQDVWVGAYLIAEEGRA